MRTSWRDRFPSSMLTDNEAVEALKEKLDAVLSTVKPSSSPRSLRPGDRVFDCHEVYPNIFLGDGFTAKNIKFLKKINITHVVNTAMGNDFGLVDTNAEFYEKDKIKFLGIKVMDVPGARISDHFETVADFIDKALATGGKVYVHCLMGISRSSTCIIAFLMIKRQMTAETALIQLRERRFVMPNDGFLRQLAALGVRLEEQRRATDNPVNVCTTTVPCQQDGQLHLEKGGRPKVCDLS